MGLASINRTGLPNRYRLCGAGASFPQCRGQHTLLPSLLVRNWVKSRAGYFIGYSGRLPAALQIAAGFWQAMFGWSDTGLLMVQLVTLLVIWLLGTRSAGSSANLQTVIALLVIALVAAIWWQGISAYRRSHGQRYKMFPHPIYSTR